MSDDDEDFRDDEEEIEDESDDDATEAVADTDADVEVEEDEEDAVAAPAARARKAEPAEVHSTAARAALRDTLAADVQAFLARGGSIEKVPDDRRADPPKKPESNYGRGSI